MSVSRSNELGGLAGTVGGFAPLDSGLLVPRAYLPQIAGLLHNMTSASNPGVADDSDDGYGIGSRWLNTTLDEEFVCLDASVGAAVWRRTTSGRAEALAAGDVTVGVATWTNVLSLALPAGNWDVWAQIFLKASVNSNWMEARVRDASPAVFAIGSMFSPATTRNFLSFFGSVAGGQTITMQGLIDGSGTNQALQLDDGYYSAGFGGSAPGGVVTKILARSY